jgi:hypothetical protein
MPTAIYQIKVTLLGTKPPIWRRLLVPANLTLPRLHRVLQIAMGWTNSHLYMFQAGREFYSPPDPEDLSIDPGAPADDRKVRLDHVLESVRAKLIYIYDMGDSWEHSIVLEKLLPADPKLKYPVCLGGQRACPPEDCGGIPGFYDLVMAGEDYDPDAFSVEEVNRSLR